jgi:hypothetical protein
LLGPPAKKFVSPPGAEAGNVVVPYRTAVKFEVVPHSGGGTTAVSLSAPWIASAPGF